MDCNSFHNKLLTERRCTSRGWLTIRFHKLASTLTFQATVSVDIYTYAKRGRVVILAVLIEFYFVSVNGLFPSN